MAFIPNKQEANSPVANAVTRSENLAVVKNPGSDPTEVLVFATGDSSLSPAVDDAYYLIIQNVTTVNLELAFNNATVGMILYPSATFECAIEQGTQIWAINSNTVTDGALRIVSFR